MAPVDRVGVSRVTPVGPSFEGVWGVLVVSVPGVQIRARRLGSSSQVTPGDPSLGVPGVTIRARRLGSKRGCGSSWVTPPNLDLGVGSPRFPLPGSKFGVAGDATLTQVGGV